jgi:GST-like protein
MRQVPTLVPQGGEVMTESAAILLYLADAYPQAHLAPLATKPLRRQYLRWRV